MGTLDLQIPKLRTGSYFPKGRVIPFLERRNILPRIAETDPNEVVFFFCSENRGLGARRGGLIRMGGDASASSGAVVFPAVIGAREAIVGDSTA